MPKFTNHYQSETIQTKNLLMRSILNQTLTITVKYPAISGYSKVFPK